MSEWLVPHQLREFIFTHIDSVSQLEALLVLRRDPDRAWTAGHLEKVLYVGKVEAREILSGLVASNLAVTDGATFRFNLANDEQRVLVDCLAENYFLNLRPITAIIHENCRLPRSRNSGFTRIDR